MMEQIQSKLLQGLIITGNEEPNIARVLDKLAWLERIVIIDSWSTDRTVELIRSYPNTELHYRKFDSFARQCNYGLRLLTSDWVLSLDADYVLTDGFIAETRELIDRDDRSRDAYNASFRFLIYGKELISNNTTPRPVLFRRHAGIYIDDGHAHRLELTGPSGHFVHPILHDDRKSLSRWLKNQDSYSLKECAKLLDPSNPAARSPLNRIRRTKVLAPFLVFFYCIFYRGLLLSGWAGWYYILQRTMVEMLWAIRMIEAQHFSIPFPEEVTKKNPAYESTETHA
ncbi:MAG TPA: glycosyltransferase family 2 protein [Sphingobacteriaceae bacterium]